ncbi:hypothetical protein P3T73_05900 [Kiritimatiellota bacterium B12222]|nr:hypothetical protein P3T73_05900 [Kiritimatiellota bacterium B12222]
MSYLDLLSPWPAAVRSSLYRFPHAPELACYGPGNQGHWAQQANTTAAAAFAVLATDPDLDAKKAGMSRDELLDWALGLIRFTLSTHHSGKHVTTDGQTWGHSWISTLCLERMWHGIEALEDHFPDADREQVHRVLLSEADWILNHYPVIAGPVENNKPESNIWNGCLLHRAALMLPDAPNAQAYQDRGTSFLLNGISIPEDAFSSEIIDGKALSDWHKGNNMFSSMGCNHHGYQNVGYMVICLSNIAMMHFHCKAKGWKAPTALYHHAEELWKVIKACTFDDGRLMRIGGDTRTRYCYCQDYAIPSWLWARDYLGDMDTLTYEKGWKQQVATEVAVNGDNTFLSNRLHNMKTVSPLYYLRLEGDRAATLSMGAYWNRKYQLDSASTPATTPQTLSSWHDDYHGSCLARGKNRMASWTWRAAEAPQGLITAKNQSSMAEWRYNLAGEILGVGRAHDLNCEWTQAETFTDGFATCGSVTIHTHSPVAEGDIPANIANVDVACVALPDDQSMVVLQRARAKGRPYLRSVKGLHLNIANDLFNSFSRTLFDDQSPRDLSSCPPEAETIDVSGDWLNIDNSLSVLKGYGPPLCIHRPSERQVTIYPKNGRIQVNDAGGSLYADEICCGCITGMQAFDPDATLFDLGVLIQVGVSAAQTRSFAQQNMPVPLDLDHPDLRGVQVVDAQGKTHRIVANFSKEEIVIQDVTYPALHVHLS